MKINLKKFHVRVNWLGLARRSFPITAAAALALFGVTLWILMSHLPRALGDTEAASALQAASGVRSLDEKKIETLFKFIEDKRRGADLNWDTLDNSQPIL